MTIEGERPPVDRTVGARTEQSFLESLPQAALDQLWMSGTLRRVRADTSIYPQGARSTEVYIVVSGLVKASMVSLNGNDMLLTMRGPGDLLGAIAAIDARRRLTDATAATDGEVLELSRGRFLDLIDNAPGLAHQIMVGLSRQIRELATHVLELSTVDTTSLIASRLVSLASHDRFEPIRTVDTGMIVIEPALTQHDLAAWAGVSDRSCGTALATFREAGAIRTSRQRIEILDLVALRQAAAR